MAVNHVIWASLWASCSADVAGYHKGFLNQRGDDSMQTAVRPISRPDLNTPIHISISAFKDGDRCARTIDWALSNAMHPDRLSFGVLQAKNNADIDCIEHFKKDRLSPLCNSLIANAKLDTDEAGCVQLLENKIKVKYIDLSEAKGPNHQRSFQAQLISFDRDDKMCMQIDSHMDFLRNWDSLAIDDWNSVNNEFAVLTAYVMDLKAKGEHAENWMVDCCGWQGEGNGLLRGSQCADVPRTQQPYLTMNWAAGFSFHRCHAERNVPIDHNLEWIFTGEEIDRAARLWTSGYDLYLPTRGFVLHDYSHAGTSFMAYGNGGEAGQGAARSHRILKELGLIDGHPHEHEEESGHYYPMGKQRTVEQYMDFSRRAINHPKLQCKSLNLQRVPVADPTALLASAMQPDAHEL